MTFEMSFNPSTQKKIPNCLLSHHQDRINTHETIKTHVHVHSIDIELFFLSFMSVKTTILKCVLSFGIVCLGRIGESFEREKNVIINICVYFPARALSFY